MFGLDDLSVGLEGAVTSTSGNLPRNIYSSLVMWFQSHGYSILMGAAVFTTILFVFYGAFLYFTAYGDENRATQAKKTLSYAFVGLLIVLLAFTIASFVQRLLLGGTQSQLQVPSTSNQNVDPRTLNLDNISK